MEKLLVFQVREASVCLEDSPLSILRQVSTDGALYKYVITITIESTIGPLLISFFLE